MTILFSRLSRWCRLLLPGLVWGSGAMAAQEPERAVQFTGDIGLVNAAGNSRVTTLSIGDRLLVRAGKVLLTQTFALVYGRNDGELNANNQQARIRAEYPAGGRILGYGFVGYERNRFAGIARRTDQGVGVSWAALQTERHELQIEAGAGLAQEKVYPDPELEETTSRRFLSGRTAFRYRYRFNPTAHIQQSLEFLPDFNGGQAHRLASETVLVAPISRNIALKASYLIKYNRTPPSAELAKTDRLLTTGLQISL